MTNTSTNTSLALAATAMAAVLVFSAAFAGVTLGTVGAASTSTPATGPLNVTYADSVATAVSADGESRQPKIVFNQSRTIDAAAGDEFVVENVDTGTSVSVVPSEQLNVSAGDALELEVVEGDGTQSTDPTIQLEHNDTATTYNATVSGDFANTFQAPYSNLTVTFVDDGAAVDSTERAAIHPVDYDAAFQQNSTSGTVLLSFARDGLPTNSQVDYTLFGENVDVPLSYNATSDRFEGTLDVSSLNESTYPGGAFFTHPDDGFYFGANGDLVVNRSGSSDGTSSGGGGGGTGPVDISHSTTIFGKGDANARGRRPGVTFNQSITLDSADDLVVTNVESGAQTLVEPTGPINVTTDDDVALNVVLGDGSADSTPELQLHTPENNTYFTANVSGNVSGTFRGPYSNLTIAYVDNGTTVDTTGESIHPYNYTKDHRQNSTNGTVRVSLARDGLPKSTTVDYSVYQENVSGQLTYNATEDAFVGTVDTSSLPDGTYSVYPTFRTTSGESYFFTSNELVVNGSSDGGSTASGPLSVTFDSSVSTTSSGDGTPTSSTPYVVFNQSRTLDGSGGDYLILTNTNTGANLTVTPTEPVSIDAMSEVGLDIYNGSGAIRSPRLTVNNGTWSYYDVEVSGNVSGTVTAPYANYTVTFVNDTTEVTTTPEDIIHPIGYLGEVRQTGTTGTIEVSVPRDGLPRNSSVRVTVHGTAADSSLSYNSSADTFDGTLDVSELSDGTYRAGVLFDTAEDGFYFAFSSDLLVGQEPSATFADQTTNGTYATIDAAYLPNGGFLTVRDDSLSSGAVFDSVLGVSPYLSAGNHSDVTVRLGDPIAYNQTLIAMPHTDSNGNQQFDFVDSEGAEDGPYVDTDGNVITDSANATVDLTGEPGDASVYLEPANRTVDVGENVTYLVRVANPGAGVGALNISVAPSTTDVEIVDAGLPPGTELTEVAYRSDGSVQLRAAGMDTGTTDPVVAAITVQGAQAGNGTLVPTVDTLADERGLEYNVTAAASSNYTVTRPSLTLDLVPSNAETRVGERNAYTLVARNVDDGVGAMNVTVTLDDASVVDIVDNDVAGSPDLRSSVHETANGTETLTIRAAGMDTPDTGDMPIAAVYLEGAQQGNATLTLEGNVVATEAGTEYVVSNTPTAPVDVPQPKVDVFVAPENNDVQAGETFTVDIVSDTNTLGVYGEEFTLAFNETLLNATEVTEGPFLSKDGAETFVASEDIDNTNGTVDVGISRKNTSTTVSGTGVVASVTFRVDENATRGVDSPLALTTVKVSDENANAVPHRRFNGTAYVPVNLPPELNATLVSTVVNEGQPVKVRAEATDSDGNVTTVSLHDPNGTELDSESCESVCLHTLSATPNFHTWNGSGYGTTTVYTVAVDDDGADATRELTFKVYTAGDANGDGVVDIFDASTIGTAWNAQRGDAAYSDAADQNNDGVVDIFDASILGTNWNDEATTNSTSS
ncbi:DUF7282 domain-containing protein [Halorarius litoreus]|uniref:DUF7282 domain-containing protein n=1 Tax=Halorarius litoreus TaxID=2962676 RepID=UPI0020CDD9FF|nr:dockerin type I domain-containing protein [Halorarius litoreus]